MVFSGDAGELGDRGDLGDDASSGLRCTCRAIAYFFFIICHRRLIVMILVCRDLSRRRVGGVQNNTWLCTSPRLEKVRLRIQ
jgi:hypothetical protein